MSQPTPDVPTATHRDLLFQITPWWLHGFNLVRLLYVIGVHIDAVAEQLVQGVRRRFPGLDANDSLGTIGKDRRIRRGRGETDATYASRLLRWLDDHARRGGPYAMLFQLAAHYATAPMVIDLVYLNGTSYTLNLDGTITRGTVGGFAPDSDPARGRWWLFIHWPSTIPTDGIWSDPGTWDDGGVWDSSLSPSDVTDLRLVPSEWGNAHSSGTIVLLPPATAVSTYTTLSAFVRLGVGPS